VGSRKPHKNLPRLLEAYSISGVRREVRLVLTGSPDEQISGEIERLGLSGDVVFADSYADGDLSDVYRGALALVFPSLYEVSVFLRWRRWLAEFLSLRRICVHFRRSWAMQGCWWTRSMLKPLPMGYGGLFRTRSCERSCGKRAPSRKGILLGRNGTQDTESSGHSGRGELA